MLFDTRISILEKPNSLVVNNLRSQRIFKFNLVPEHLSTFVFIRARRSQSD